VTTSAAKDVWTFADLCLGHTFGEISFTLDAGRLAQWDAIYGGDQNLDNSARALPVGLLVTCMMEAYLSLIQPRPPGNIHAGQSLVFGTGHVRLGDTVNVTVICQDKTERKGRGWVTLAATVAHGDETLLRGEIQVIWAKLGN
jgi:hypothetical protein